MSTSPSSDDDTGSGRADAPAPTAAGTAAAPMLRIARRRLSWRAVAIGCGSLAIPLLIWWAVAAVVHHYRTPVFPTPYSTGQDLLELLGGRILNDFTIYQHIGDSLTRWAAGFGIAMVVGIIMGLLVGWSRLLERLTMPSITVIQLVPGLAWIPVAILLFGIGERTTIFMIAITALAPIVINTSAGVKGVDEMHLRAARMMGADDRTIFLRVLLPGSLPHLLSGLRVGFANGWRVLVAGEMVVGTGTGLGYSIIQARWTGLYDSAFACIAIICMIGLTVERGILLPLERRTVERWGLARSG